MKKMSVQCVPYHATTTSGATTNAAAALPSPGTAVTVVDNQLANASDGTHSGNYVVESAKIARSNTGIAIITLDLEQVVDNDISTTRT
jgi:hypothetical protein